jgi:pyridoxine kinase
VRLSRLGVKKIAVTGIHYGENMVGTFGYDTGIGFLYGREHVKKSYPGTGDLFASVLLGEMLRGKDFRSAIVSASEFTGRVIEYSSGFDTPTRNGVAFEPFLSELGK